MSTESQISANRINAQASTGPTSAIGKRNAAWNSLPHIKLARQVLAITENPKTFCELVEKFYAQFNPKDEAECHYVETMAISRWKGLRASSLEAAEVTAACDTQSYNETDEEGAALVTAAAYKQSVRDSKVLDLYTRNEMRHLRMFDKAHSRLLQVREAKQRCTKMQQTNPAESDLHY